MLKISVIIFCSLVSVFPATGQNFGAASTSPTINKKPCEAARRMPSPNYPRPWIRIMPSRYHDLSEAVEGYRHSAVPLVALTKEGYKPAGYGDDVGLYYFVPLLGRVFQLDLTRSISIFFGFSFVLCFAVGGVGLMLFCQTVAARVIAGIAWVLLAIVVYHLGDVYLFEGAIPIVLIPWFLYLLRENHGGLLTKFLLMAGLALGTVSLIRGDAALPTLVFLTAGIFLCTPVATRRKIAFLALLAFGVAVPNVAFRHVTSQRNRFLTAYANVNPVDLERHTFWHLAYLGLGYVNLPGLPLETCDEVGKMKVASVAPQASFLTKAYDDVLRAEVLDIVPHHPFAVLLSVLAKVGTTLLVILMFANIGILAAFVYPKSRALDEAFWSALVVVVMPLVIVVPQWQYLVGVISLATIYGVVSIEHALRVLQLRGRPTNNQPVSMQSKELEVEYHSA